MKNSPSAVAGGLFFCVAGMGSFAPPGASSFLSSLKESYQRKPLKTTFQDFLARECAGVAPAGASLRRPHFFLRRKKCGKESRLDLRSKGPLARCGSCKIGGADLAELVRRSSLSVKRTVPAFIGAEASATACPSHGRGVCFYRVGGVSPPRRRAGVAPAGAGWGVSCPGASSFLSSLKESYQRKPLETTFQDFLGAGTAGANLTVCTRGRGAAVITVGQKDCACVHRRGGWRGRLPQPR